MATPQNYVFTDAKKESCKLRIALNAEGGGGKTFTALVIASRICQHYGGNIALIDSEHSRANLYADIFKFKHLILENHSLDNYMGAIEAAHQQGFTVAIVDTLSHAWAGRGGALEELDKTADAMRSARSGNKNTFNAWGVVRPKLNRLIDLLNYLDMHLICNFRMRKKNSQSTQADGSTKIEFLGLEPIGPPDIDYEFDFVGEIVKSDKSLVLTKTRCWKMASNTIFRPIQALPLDLDHEGPGRTQDIVDQLVDWLKAGEVVTPRLVAPTTPAPGSTAPRQDPNAAYTELFRRYRAINDVAAYHKLVQAWGLREFDSRHNLEAADQSLVKECYRHIKAIIEQRELEAKLATLPAADPTPSPTTDPAAAADTPRCLNVNDFTEAEFAEMLHAYQNLRGPQFDEGDLAQLFLQYTSRADLIAETQKLLYGRFEAPTLTIDDLTKNELTTLWGYCKAVHGSKFTRTRVIDEVIRTYRGAKEALLEEWSRKSADTSQGAAQ